MNCRLLPNLSRVTYLHVLEHDAQFYAQLEIHDPYRVAGYAEKYNPSDPVGGHVSPYRISPLPISLYTEEGAPAGAPSVLIDKALIASPGSIAFAYK